MNSHLALRIMTLRLVTIICTYVHTHVYMKKNSCREIWEQITATQTFFLFMYLPLLYPF